MAFANQDLHGNAPDKAKVGLLLIDVINDLDFPEGELLLRHALPMARRLVELKRRAKEAEHPRNLCQRQLWTLAVKLQYASRTLHERRRSGTGAG